jgi:hypothetical protein
MEEAFEGQGPHRTVEPVMMMIFLHTSSIQLYNNN